VREKFEWYAIFKVRIASNGRYTETGAECASVPHRAKMH
jgi:hypothetical protein